MSKNKTQQSDVVVLGGVSENKTSIPLYTSRPQAGFPTPGDDTIEKILDINDLVVKNHSSTCCVRVEGDSMICAGIFSGDTLVVDRSLTPKNKSIIVAAVYGEMTIKRLRTKGSSHELVSENDTFEPIVLENNDDCFVWGVVVGSVRRFL
jgi:DNA polymerase V